MTDRFTRGVVAGVIAGIIPMIFNNLVFYISLSDTRWAEFVGTFLLGSKPDTTAETIMSLVGLVIFLGLLGAIFSMITPVVSSNYYWLKGFLYGVVIYFSSFAYTVTFRVPGLTTKPLMTVLMNFIGAAMWGIILAIVLKWLYRRVET